MVGHSAGYGAAKLSRCVFIGFAAGQFFNRSDTLAIHAGTPTTNPLVYGEFDTPFLRINGGFNATGISTFGSDVTISGNLAINGTTTTVSTANLNVTDPLVKFAKDNAADTLDVGFFGQYYTAGVKRYAGLIKKNTGSVFELFSTDMTGTAPEPGTTVSSTGYALASLNLLNLTGTTLTGSTHVVTSVLNLGTGSSVTGDNTGMKSFLGLGTAAYATVSPDAGLAQWADSHPLQNSLVFSDTTGKLERLSGASTVVTMNAQNNVELLNKGTAFNADFGTGNSDVLRGNTVIGNANVTPDVTYNRWLYSTPGNQTIQPTTATHKFLITGANGDADLVAYAGTGGNYGSAATPARSDHSHSTSSLTPHASQAYDLPGAPTYNLPFTLNTSTGVYPAMAPFTISFYGNDYEYGDIDCTINAVTDGTNAYLAPSVGTASGSQVTIATAHYTVYIDVILSGTTLQLVFSGSHFRFDAMTCNVSQILSFG